MHTILLGDDNDSVREAVTDALARREDWRICGKASNGREAVEMAAALQPDVIVLDFRMPSLNGLEAAAEIQRARPSACIILYTLHADARLDQQAKAIGIRHVIAKTAPFSDLTAAIDEALGTTLAVGPLGPIDAVVSMPAAEVDAALTRTSEVEILTSEVAQKPSQS